MEREFHNGLTKSRAAILDLPSEILLQIFEVACPSYSSNNASISGVCRQFRDLALVHAPLWVCISNLQSLEWCRIQLERSKNRSLHVNFRGRDEWWDGTCNIDIGCQCPSFLEEVLEHRERILSFTFAVHHTRGSDRAKDISFLIDLHLPRLTHLQLNDVGLGITSDRQEYRICRSWRMPALRVLECTTPSMDFLYAGSIQVARIGRTSYPRMDVNTFLGFLSRYHDSLEQLEFTIPNFLNTTHNNQSNEKIHLCDLRSLCVHYVGEQDLTWFTGRALACIYTPKLEELRICLKEATLLTYLADIDSIWTGLHLCKATTLRSVKLESTGLHQEEIDVLSSHLDQQLGALWTMTSSTVLGLKSGTTTTCWWRRLDHT